MRLGAGCRCDVDALVIKDAQGLPFVPGKTIKGLVREALAYTLSQENKSKGMLTSICGQFKDKDNCTKGRAFFTDATLHDDEKNVIVRDNLARFLYQSVSATAIDNDGIAKDKSLRKTETTLPCTLYGQIMNLEDQEAHEVERALMMIKRLGAGRTRGYGRCNISMEEKQ
ncbi:RAMP superfamily CRISPR-associated protein [Hoylesella shahii]|uniref:RAMP superfamily CRISPR-associated protein n=1 Tax=Hoylesella shahii TaxID=228603 RepID=UPI001E53F83A|nr:RAMP superfamily CRISPR-associated protein [Hoylesella shahii]